VNALFASDATASSLSDAQREILEEAASETFAFASELVPTSDTIDAFCSGGGQLVAAEPRDLEALERAARPVYATLERDRETAAFIERIRELEESSTPGLLPTSCDAS
jgi:TRAP-type C4-dicarboxylate transport system substrate-binding protein